MAEKAKKIEQIYDDQKDYVAYGSEKHRQLLEAMRALDPDDPADAKALKAIKLAMEAELQPTSDLDKKPVVSMWEPNRGGVLGDNVIDGWRKQGV